MTRNAPAGYCLPRSRFAATNNIRLFGGSSRFEVTRVYRLPVHNVSAELGGLMSESKTQAIS